MIDSIVRLRGLLTPDHKIVQRDRNLRKTELREIYVVSSRLSIVELFPHALQRAPGIRFNHHWALEIGGNYYELHRLEWKECRIRRDDGVETSRRKIVHRALLGYTHHSDQELVDRGKACFVNILNCNCLFNETRLG